MLGTLGSIAIKYWVEFLFGLVAIALTAFVKKFWAMYKAERKRTQEELVTSLRSSQEEILNSVKKEQEELIAKFSKEQEDLINNIVTRIDQERMESINADLDIEKRIDTLDNNFNSLKAGILSIQRKQFIAECRRLLSEDHELTLDEWEELESDHEVYNSLGGNHRGDHWFSLVQKKAENSLTGN